ncbi:MAG: ABC transporter substrate-binding protein [Candidatus Eremiobacteraeota bacterium]|nr:ABC transporter substrate-binding protein [Candidatus Eremiobacteraeota bacterium]
MVLALSLIGTGASPARAADASIVISQGVDSVTLDPLKRTITPTDNVLNNLFDTMLRRDRDGKLIPWLATSWKRVAPTVWEFHLRRDAKFWNGDPVTSADVRFSIEKVKDPAEASEQTPFVATVERIETPDPYTVRFITARPAALIPANPWYVRVVSAKYWKEHGDAYQAEHPMGSAAYVFKSWRKDESLVMEANPNWWGGKPLIERVTFKPIPEPAARVAALRTGEADLITNVPSQYQLQIEGGAKTKLESARSVRVLFVAFNTLKPGPQQDKRVRQALNYALDVPAIIRTVLGGRGYEAATPLPPNFFGYDPAIPFYRHDLAKAKQLLAAAGYPDGKGLDLVLNAPTGRYNKDKEIAEAIAGQLSQTGAKVTTKIQEWTSYVNQTSQRALTPMYELGWGSSSYDADNTLDPLFSLDGRLATYSNPQLDKLILDARYELDVKKRLALYSKALGLIHEEAPWLFLFQYEDVYATSKRLVWHARSDELLYCDEMKLAATP